jgi:hypothetical protein
MMYRYDDFEGILIRKIAPSITIDYAKSEKQTTLHVKIHKAQVKLNFNVIVYKYDLLFRLRLTIN